VTKMGKSFRKRAR